MTTTTTTSHHRYHSLGNIPFSWENSPGISKVAPRPRFDDSPTAPCTYVDVVDVHHRKLSKIAKPIAEKLPPPPSTDDSRPIEHSSGGRSNLLIPLPPCMFHHAPPHPQQPHRRSASRGYRPRKEDDPFLAAYKECTKSFNKDKRKGTAAKDQSKKGGGWLGLGFISCKQGSGVRDDSMVMVPSARNSAGLLQIRDTSLERSRSSGITGMAVRGNQRRKSMSI